jgi:hypothetical protein
MKILRFEQFLSESLNFVNESGIPLYVGTSVNPLRSIKRNTLIKELEDLISQANSGDIKEVSVLAEIPTQGKNTPQYLKDIYTKSGMGEEDEDMYDEETDVYLGDRDSADKTIFVDSEFVVKSINHETGMIVASPYSLRNKEVFVEIDPDTVEEIFVK